MVAKFIFWIALISISASIGQAAEVKCVYTHTDYGYTCTLTIDNPSGLNNIITIGGTHLSGYNNNNVQAILSGSASTTLNIPSIICGRFNNVFWIELIGMGIQKIDDYSFSSCTLLSYLDVHSNKISSINERAFDQNRELRYFYAYYNNLPSLPENVFANQANMHVLWFDTNNITDLPKYVFRPLTNLVSLSLQVNDIETLRPEWFETLGNLRNLYLHWNFLTDLPKNIFNSLKGIRHINLYANYLRAVHADSFGMLTNLESINLNYNDLEAVDENLINYTGINYINLGRNFCANSNITDYSSSRELIRTVFRRCFKNYENLMSACRLNTMIESSNGTVLQAKKNRPSKTIIDKLETEIDGLSKDRSATN